MKPFLKTSQMPFVTSLCILAYAVLFNQQYAVAQNATKPFEDIFKHRLGFAKNVTGGSGGEVVVIDKLDIKQLRDALTGNEPRWIRFKPGLKGKIELDGNLFIGSNKTIDGRGADVTITSPGDCDEFIFWGIENGKPIDRSNLIVHNIKIIKVGKGDNCGQGLGIAYGAKNVWVDHVTFSSNGDESFSMGKGATNVTVSWCKFIDTDKAILLSWGASDRDSNLDEKLRATIHHCYFLRVNGRSPALRFGKVHYFNNFLKDWNWSGVNTTMGGEIYSENNIYAGGRWDNSPPALSTQASKGAPKPGYIKTVGDLFLSKKGNGSNGPGINKGKVFDPQKFYQYKADIADKRLQKRLEQQCGWLKNL